MGVQTLEHAPERWLMTYACQCSVSIWIMPLITLTFISPEVVRQWDLIFVGPSEQFSSNLKGWGRTKTTCYCED